MIRINNIVIGIDQSYKRTGITILKDKQIVRMQSLDFKNCENNTDKRNYLWTVLERFFKTCAKPNKDNNVTIICERIRLKSQGFINEDYIKSTGALIATIIDVARLYNIPVYSVDTRSWKSAIVGNSKPQENPYGIDPHKYPTILYMRNKGLLKYIAYKYEGKGKKGIIKVNMSVTEEGKTIRKKVPCKINDDLADSYCIAFYGFLSKSKQKLKEENI